MVQHVYERDAFPILSSPLWTAFAATVERDGTALAVVDGDRRVSRQQLHDIALHLATRLHHLGVGRGDMVVLKGTNSVETVAAVLAVSRQGAVIVPTPAGYGRRETDYVVGKVDPAVVL